MRERSQVYIVETRADSKRKVVENACTHADFERMEH